jgi:hypothetical protein
MFVEWITVDMLYWLGSSIAQSVVALLAFGAFLGAWRRDAIWESVEPLLPSLASNCRTFKDEEMTVSSKTIDGITLHSFKVERYVDSKGEGWMNDNAIQKVAEYARATDADDRLAALVAATEPWLLRFSFPEDTHGLAPAALDQLRERGMPVIRGFRARTRIKSAMESLAQSTLSAFVISLLLIVAAEPATGEQSHPAAVFVGFGLLVLLLITTALSVAAARELVRSTLGEAGAPQR